MPFPCSTSRSASPPKAVRRESKPTGIRAGQSGSAQRVQTSLQICIGNRIGFLGTRNLIIGRD